MRKPTFLFATLAFSCVALAADSAPTLDWVKITGGSGSSSVAAAVSDAHGNLYIAGSTSSQDFPTTSAAQAVPGGSMLVRINLATAAATRLYPANLPPISFAAAAPANPGTFYAASGNEVFKSTDDGSTWTLLSSFASSVNIQSLAVDPTNSSILYAATVSNGLYKSVNGGVTWTAIDSANASGIYVDPAAPNIVFATSGPDLLRSADGGNTWTQVTTGPSYGSVAFDPFSAGTIYYASGTAIFKSTDTGQTFAPLGSPSSQAYISVLTPDPHHAGVLYAGTTSGIYQSADGGNTWTLKVAGVTTALVADPQTSSFYGNISGYGIVTSSNGFASTTPIGPNEPQVTQLIVSSTNLLEISSSTTDAFVVKLDNNGNVVYSTYFGGSGSDAATAVAVGFDGSLYVTGSTNSADLPVTSGAYLSTLPVSNGEGGGFVFKLNPDGALAWATYFPQPNILAIAVDSLGDPFVGGATAGGLPTTTGAYQTSFQQSVTSNGFFGVIGPTAGFVTKLNAKGTGLIYSTYVPTDNDNNTVEGVQALVVDAGGNAWMGVGVNPNIAAPGPNATVVELNPTGSAVLASAVQPSLGAVAALALDAQSNVYVAGYFGDNGTFPATPGAFQSAPQPAIPTLPYEASSGGGGDAFVAKFDSSLTHLLAATLLGGELPDAATSIALDASGTVIVGGYTDSAGFPTRAPFQESFSSRTGFVAGFDANLTNLLFSTYVGDTREFAVQSAVPDGNGNILLAGSTLVPGRLFVGGDNGASYSVAGVVVANKISLPPAPTVRLDSVENYASHLAEPFAPGEPVLILGGGFADGAQLVVDGTPLTTISASATLLVAVMPDNAATSGTHTLQVLSNGTRSNVVYAPTAPASPAIYSVDGSGAGQGYILNSDGTLNSPSNPAATGSAITIFAAGAGQYTLSNGYAVTAQTPAVFIDGFYANGIAAKIGPVSGLPGNVYQLSVYVPNPATLVNNNPDLSNFSFPAQSGIQLVMGTPNALNFANSPMASQGGIFINIK